MLDLVNLIVFGGLFAPKVSLKLYTPRKFQSRRFQSRRFQPRKRIESYIETASISSEYSQDNDDDWVEVERIPTSATRNQWGQKALSRSPTGWILATSRERILRPTADGRISHSTCDCARCHVIGSLRAILVDPSTLKERVVVDADGHEALHITYQVMDVKTRFLGYMIAEEISFAPEKSEA